MLLLRTTLNNLTPEFMDLSPFLNISKISFVIVKIILLKIAENICKYFCLRRKAEPCLFSSNIFILNLCLVAWSMCVYKGY